MHVSSPDRPPLAPDHPLEFTPTFYQHEATLYRLKVWSDEEWWSIDVQSRPSALHVPGLGWVGGELAAVLN